MHVLYVEDNRLDADLVLRTFERTAPGIRMEWVPTFGEAMERLSCCSADYDLVLTDMKLPDGNGLALIPYVRDNQLPISIVILTGVGNEATAVAALKAGANDYVVKGTDYLVRLPIILENAHRRFAAEYVRYARPLHVLYAEWNEADIDQTQRHMVRYAPHICLDIVGSAQEILHRLATSGGLATPDGHLYEVILLDYHLPGMSGLELLKELLETRRVDLPVVLVTGYGDEEIALQAMRLGAADYVVKNEGYLFHLPVVIENVHNRAQSAREHTALKESEERFRQLFSQNDDALFLLRFDTLAIIDANPVARNLFGLTAEDLTSGDLWGSIVDRQDFEHFVGQLPINDVSRGFQIDRATCFKKDGTRFIVSMRGKILKAGDDHIVYFSIRDITEKVRLEEEIRTTQAKLIQTNKMTSIGLLVSSVAHEINNPNTCISTNAAILTRIWQDAAHLIEERRQQAGDFRLGRLPVSEVQELVPRLFGGIADASRRIADIVANMRSLVTNGKGRVVTSVDVNAMIRSATDILWHHIRNHTDSFRMELAEGLPPARGSRQQFEQVVINLIMNALQALPDRSRGVTVETSCNDAAGTIAVTVRDEGKGMEREVIEHLTEPFFTTRIDEGGTGLGLYISSSILKEHGGSLLFESEPGKGTNAVMCLPVAEA
jgi:PAS domain S-box-containing protein